MLLIVEEEVPQGPGVIIYLANRDEITKSINSLIKMKSSPKNDSLSLIRQTELLSQTILRHGFCTLWT